MSVPLASSSMLSSSVQFLKGIGPKRAVVLEKYGIKTIHDLFFYVPRRYLDRTAIVTIAELRQLSSRFPQSPSSEPTADIRRDYTVVGDVRSFRVVGFRARSRFVLILGDDTGTMQCVWFGG